MSILCNLSCQLVDSFEQLSFYIFLFLDLLDVSVSTAEHRKDFLLLLCTLENGLFEL